MTKMTTLVERAQTKEAYDQMIGEGNAEGNATVDAAVTALLSQTKEIQRAIAALTLDAMTIEGSDSLDNPATVKQ
jgi:putative iron-regulated protein